MDLNQILSEFNPDLVSEIISNSTQIEIPKNSEVMKEGQYIKSVPIVIEGLVKVFTRKEDKEFLLYYLKPSESCIMTFDAGLRNMPSKVYASTEEKSRVLLLPMDKVVKWMKQYPEMNSLFFQQYNIRYTELINTINQILFEKMDQRLYNYLKTKSAVVKIKILKVSHQKIANDLGSAREVITRVLKKLEHEGKVLQTSAGIKVL